MKRLLQIMALVLLGALVFGLSGGRSVDATSPDRERASVTVDMCDWVSKGCEKEAAKVRQDCEYRGEESGTGYASCGCQAVRAYKACMENYGCTDHPRLTWEIEQNRDCIIDQ